MTRGAHIDYTSSRLCEEVERDTPDPTVVERCVNGGCDVLFQKDTALLPTLHYIIKRGHVGMLQQVLKTTRDVDFTVKGSHHRLTPLHCVCDALINESYPPRSVMAAMTAAIVTRLETHANDRIDWGQKNRWGHDFLSLAARAGALSLLYPLVKHQTYYACAPQPFILSSVPQRTDWEALTDGERASLDIGPRGYSEQLCEEVEREFPDLSVALHCVKDGNANILYQSRDVLLPSLHQCIVRGNIPLVTALLDTSQTVNFTIRDRWMRSPLHCIFDCGRLEGCCVMAVITAAITHRLNTHPSDRVNWSQKNNEGFDFLSLAAREGVLSHLYPLVKHQPYFVNAAKPLVLQYRPDAEDWALLSDADRTDILSDADVSSEDISISGDGLFT